MTFMLCPICREEVTGGDVIELSQALRGHLVSGHRMTTIAREESGEVVRPSYSAHDGAPMGMRESSARSGYGPLVPDRQEVTDFVVRCPFCDAEVTGRSENDLGERLGEHWSGEHGLRPGHRVHLPSGRGRTGRR